MDWGWTGMLVAGMLMAEAARPEGKARSPRETAAAFAECWNRHDMKSFADLFAADADFVNVIGLHWRGRAEIEAQHVALHQTRMKHTRLTLAEVQVRELRPDVAILHARWELTGDAGSAGKPANARRGVLSLVLSRHGGSWLIDSAQNTDIVPIPNLPPSK